MCLGNVSPCPRWQPLINDNIPQNSHQSYNVIDTELQLDIVHANGYLVNSICPHFIFVCHLLTRFSNRLKRTLNFILRIWQNNKKKREKKNVKWTTVTCYNTEYMNINITSAMFIKAGIVYLIILSVNKLVYSDANRHKITK